MNKSTALPISVIPFLFSSLTSQVEAINNNKMNIVIILADDLGWGDVGFHFSDVKTPNLDKFAQDGIVLDRFYTAPVSSPTRAGLLTGRYPNRFGLRETVIPPWRDFGLDTEEETLADMLGQAGYTHRTIIGKWHLGHSQKKYHPLSRGFTHFYGHLNGALNYFTHLRDGQLDWHNDWDPCYDQGYTTDLLTTESVKCINEYAQSDDPFFLYVAFNAPHGPLLAKEEDIALYTNNFNQLTKEEKNRVTYSAMVTCMDRGVGAPKRPFDGLDITNVLSGEQPVLTRDLYLGCGAVVNNNYKLILQGKNDKVKLTSDFLSYYPDQFYEETNVWNKAAHQTEYTRLKKIAQEFDAIVSPFVLPPYNEGQDDFKAPFEWNIDYYGKTYDFPYPITNYEDFMVVRNHLDKEYYLTNDIVIAEGTEWVPLGAAISEDNAPVKFNGKIDGKGFSVKNITITTESAYKGFIGQMENGSIKNLGIENVNIKGTTPVGGVTGLLLGNNALDQVCVTGTIQGTTEVGGFAGKSTATN